MRSRCYVIQNYRGVLDKHGIRHTWFRRHGDNLAPEGRQRRLILLVLFQCEVDVDPDSVQKSQFAAAYGSIYLACNGSQHGTVSLVFQQDLVSGQNMPNCIRSDLGRQWFLRTLARAAAVGGESAMHTD